MIFIFRKIWSQFEWNMMCVYTYLDTHYNKRVYELTSWIESLIPAPHSPLNYCINWISLVTKRPFGIYNHFTGTSKYLLYTYNTVTKWLTMKINRNEKTEVIILRVKPETKVLLQELADSKFKGNKSQLIRYLIETTRF